MAPKSGDMIAITNAAKSVSAIASTGERNSLEAGARPLTIPTTMGANTTMYAVRRPSEP
jgi:hypothetical protein